jgi:hypothetical protein
VLAFFAALCWLGWTELGDQMGRSRTLVAAPEAASGDRTAPQPPPVEPSREELNRVEAALQRGVKEAAALGGRAEAAVMLGDWRRPLVVAAGPPGPREVRMWSMSKVSTMIALLRERGWGDQPGKVIPPEVTEALGGAITRSENCRQRHVVLELQRYAGGPQATRAALADVLGAAGARAHVGSQIDLPESLCLPYLETQDEIEDPLVPALLLGTSTWRIEDAVRLVHALGEGAYGAALSKRVLDLMKQPKQASREVLEGELTAPLTWGAGDVYAGLTPAYKAGWGGALDGDFMAGQIALVVMPSGERLAIAAFFHPDAQPSRDDPGITAAPEAIATIMQNLREGVSG